MKILICPLNWGLGHASRCIPIIQNYINEGHDVYIGSDGVALQLLKLKFPTLIFVELPSYNVQYSKSNSQIIAMTRNIPRIFSGIIREHVWLYKFLKNNTFDLIISDNRFGLWSKSTKCVYITHQLMIKMPTSLKALETLVWRMHRTLISRYNQCWVPDFESDPNLSGDLSHLYPLPSNTKFIGPISRFSINKDEKISTEYSTIAIISGVEPQRKIFQNQLQKRFENQPYKVLFVCGEPESEYKYSTKNITFVSHLNDIELKMHLLGTERIICRSGYSSIMDLHALNCIGKTEFIPTPGQTEQLYLFEHLSFKASN